MRRPGSIALRLALWLSIGTGLFWLGAAAISSVVLQHELEEAFDQTLSQSAYRLLPLALHDLREPGESHRSVPAMADSDDMAFTYFVHDAAGNVIIRADDAPDDVAVVPTTTGYFDFNGQRAYAISDERSGLGIVVLDTSNHRQEALGEAAGALFWPLAGLLPLIAIGIWWAVRLSMRPLRRFAQDVALRDQSNLTPLDVDGQPPELAPIAREVAALLERLKAAMEGERSFAANSAHELRTPIAGALAQTQRLALELGDHPARQRATDIERALRHLASLSEKLLQLARLDAGFARADAPVDLTPALSLVLHDFDASPAAAGRVRLTSNADLPLLSPVNPDAFAIALRNVIQNALTHGAPEGPVLVEAIGPVITVTNTGPAVPPEVLARLGTRFARGDASTSGTGLGLSIVKTIMDQVGGRLDFASPLAGEAGGFAVTLAFPTAPLRA